MTFTRRTALSLIPAGVALSACGGFGGKSKLQTLVDGPVGARAPAAGYVLMKGGKVLASEAVGEAIVGQRAFSVRTPFRAASISKIVTAMTASSLHKSGEVDWNAPLNDLMGLPPAQSVEAKVTIKTLLSHTSGLQDPDVYWFAHPTGLEKMRQAVKYSPQQAGRFEYCNFGYGWVAAALESATGRRFDRLTEDLIFKRDGLDIGFNWAGVSLEKRKTGAALYRETNEGWTVQTDGPETLNSGEPGVLIDRDADLATYTPGQNGTLFSPQGGLRANLLDLAMLAERLKYAPELTAPVWQLNAAEDNGVHDQRYYAKFGTGVHIHEADESLWTGQLLWGHHGEAYGLFAGAWYVPELDVSFAYAVTGTPETPPPRSSRHPSLDQFTEVLMDAVIAAYESSPAAK